MASLKLFLLCAFVVVYNVNEISCSDGVKVRPKFSDLVKNSPAPLRQERLSGKTVYSAFEKNLKQNPRGLQKRSIESDGKIKPVLHLSKEGVSEQKGKQLKQTLPFRFEKNDVKKRVARSAEATQVKAAFGDNSSLIGKHEVRSGKVTDQKKISPAIAKVLVRNQ